ncbi:MAG: hypothetical protein ACI841_001199, partial [Planctomycetota bacterium]
DASFGVEAAISPDGENSQAYASLRPFLELTGSATLGEGSGELSTQRAGFDATLGFVEADSEFAVHVFTEASFYDIGEPAGSLATIGDPFNDLYRTGLGIERIWGLDEDFAWQAGAELVFGGEDDVSPIDSAQLGGMLAVLYNTDEDAGLTLGIAVQSRLEDDPWIYPFLGFHWSASDSLSFVLEGPEGSATYEVTDNWDATLKARFDMRQYRLNENGPLTGGAFRDEEIRLTAGLDWRPKAGVEFSAEVGRVIWHELSFFDDSDEKIVEIESADANWAGLSLTVSF